MSVHLSWITIFLGIPTVPRRGHHLQSDEAPALYKAIKESWRPAHSTAALLLGSH